MVVAIKIIPVEGMDLEDTIKEISFMKEFTSNHVVRYYGKYFHDGNIWIVIEYCGGGSVQDVLKVLGPLQEHQISCMCKHTLMGLKYLHSLGKMHRDIKAGNILLTDEGEPKLADFGVSGQLSAELTKRHTVIGTPFWMAPEVIQEVGYDQKADIWSLGVTLIEMAERKPPHSDIHPMRALFVIPQSPPPALKNPEKWTPHFHDFLARCLQKDPDKRPDTEELLKHPFVAKVKGYSALEELLENFRDANANFHDEEEDDLHDDNEAYDEEEGEEEEESGFLQDSGGEEEEEEEEDWMGGETMVLKSGSEAATPSSSNAAAEFDDYDFDSGTMVAYDNNDNSNNAEEGKKEEDDEDLGFDEFSTMVISSTSEVEKTKEEIKAKEGSSYVPEFMQHVNKMQADEDEREKKKQEYRNKANQNDYLKLSYEDLQALIEKRRERHEKEVDRQRALHLEQVRQINDHFDGLSRPILNAIETLEKGGKQSSASSVFSV